MTHVKRLKITALTLFVFLGLGNITLHAQNSTTPLKVTISGNETAVTGITNNTINTKQTYAARFILTTGTGLSAGAAVGAEVRAGDRPGVQSYMRAGTTGPGLFTYQTGQGLGMRILVTSASNDQRGAWVKTNGTGWSGYFEGGKGFYSDRISIGSEYLNSDYALAVAGDVIAERVEVKLEGNWPDYVFSEDYDLMDINSLGNFIDENGHLPHMPSAKEVEEEGSFDLGNTQVKMLRTIEELSLHIIDLQKQIEELKK